MKTATGEISSFLGQIAVELKLGKNLIKHKVLIANIPDLSHGNYCFSNRYFDYFGD
jgi:hypothetical protein